MKKAKLYYRAAKAYDLKKDITKAIDYARKCLELSKDSATEKYLKKLRDKESRIAFREHYQKKDPNDSYNNSIMEKLKLAKAMMGAKK